MNTDTPLTDMANWFRNRASKYLSIAERIEEMLNVEHPEPPHDGKVRRKCRACTCIENPRLFKQDEGIRVFCPNCNLSTCQFKTEEDAWQAWNSLNATPEQAPAPDDPFWDSRKLAQSEAVWGTPLTPQDLAPEPATCSQPLTDANHVCARCNKTVSGAFPVCPKCSKEITEQPTKAQPEASWLIAMLQGYS